jgi:hypothetical protein
MAALGVANALPIENRRYSRLKICATLSPRGLFKQAPSASDYPKPAAHSTDDREARRGNAGCSNLAPRQNFAAWLSYLLATSGVQPGV